MLDLWRNKGFDEVLYDAWNNGKVISGISAGAVCWFKSCDSEKDNKYKEEIILPSKELRDIDILLSKKHDYER